MAKEYSSILESINHGLSNPVQDETQMEFPKIGDP